MLPADEREQYRQQFLKDFGWDGKCFIISALTGEGCKEVVYAIMEFLDQNRPPEEPTEDSQEAQP
jgi:GTP-binding protein